MVMAGGLAALAGCGAPTKDAATVEGEAPVAATPGEIVAFAAGAEFVVGENRFSFGLFTHEDIFIPEASVRANFYQLNTGSPVFKAAVDAVYHETEPETRHLHDDGEDHLHREATGIYLVESVEFDEPGFWGVRMEVTMPVTGTVERPALALEVRAEPVAIAVGEPAPKSRNLTIADAAELGDITTMPEPVPAFYARTVADALTTGMPLVVAFATPAFCVSRMCGPVMDVVARVHRQYGDRAGFVHIEPYDLEAARTTGRLELVEAAAEWRLPTEPWVFVVGTDGTVRARIEGLFAEQELIAELERVLN